jgi:hypothetical protein
MNADCPHGISGSKKSSLTVDFLNKNRVLESADKRSYCHHVEKHRGVIVARKTKLSSRNRGPGRAKRATANGLQSASLARKRGSRNYDTERPVDMFKVQFASEIAVISKLNPFASNPQLLAEWLPKLADFVFKYTGRFVDSDYLDGVRRCVQSALRASEEIEAVSNLLLHLDAGHAESVLGLVEAFAPDFLKCEHELLGVRLHQARITLRAFSNDMVVLSGAVSLATGITDEPKGRGRPVSRHVYAASELIALWCEMTGNAKFPNPKSLDVSDSQTDEEHFGSKQPSTEFVGHVLRMIDPKISNSQVFTAIKHALTGAEDFKTFLSTAPGKEVLDALGQLLGKPLELP